MTKNTNEVIIDGKNAMICQHYINKECTLKENIVCGWRDMFEKNNCNNVLNRCLLELQWLKKEDETKEKRYNILFSVQEVEIKNLKKQKAKYKKCLEEIRKLLLNSGNSYCEQMESRFAVLDKINEVLDV